MIRFALFFLLVYVLYRLFRYLFGSPGAGAARKKRKPSFDSGPPQVSEMVQDPVCRVYVPKKEALHLEKDGRRYYFCSRACMETFQKHEGP